MKPIPVFEASDWMVICSSGIPNGTELLGRCNHLAIIILSLLPKVNLVLIGVCLSALSNGLDCEKTVLRNGSTCPNQFAIPWIPIRLHFVNQLRIEVLALSGCVCDSVGFQVVLNPQPLE